MIEQLIIKGALENKEYLDLITNTIESKFFDNNVLGEIFNQLKEYNINYFKIAPRSIIINNVKESEHIFNELDSIDFNVINNYDYLFEKTNDFLKEKSIISAILESVSIIKEKKENIEVISKLISNAISKDLKVDLGLNYFDSLLNRLKRNFENQQNKVPSFFPIFDEYISGGFPKYSLSVFVAKIHGRKSQTISNFASRQVLNGYNVAVVSLEMSELQFAQRFDALYSKLDINKIYVNEKEKKLLIKSLKGIKTNNKNLGSLFIKEFPTGQASVNDIRTYLRELRLRGYVIDIIYVDYINLMKPSYKTKSDMYSDIKKIAEELRALGLEFDLPVISVSQLNREGSGLELKELDFRFISESLGIPATADFMAIYGDNDDMVYNSELWYKIVKNRFGKMGVIDKFYYDERSLKLYDSNELDEWRNDSLISGDDRLLFNVTENNKKSRKKK